jgi:integrase
MARSSFQCGTTELKTRKSGDIWSIRYRVRDPNSPKGWRHKRELLPGCKTEKQARKILSLRTAEINIINNNARPPGIFFAAFVFGLWQSYLTNRQIRPSTKASYQSLLDNYALPELGNKQLDRIRPEDITAFFCKLETEGLSSKSRLNLYGLLKLMFEVAVEYELLSTNPVRCKLHRPQHKAKKKPALAAGEIRRILDNIAGEHQPLFITIALTGQRIGELLALRWGDIDLTSRKLSIKHSLWRGTLGAPKTEASERTLHIPSILSDILLEYRQRSRFIEDEDFIFCKADGTPCDPGYLRNKVLYPALDAAGIKRSARTHGFHLFRHSAGSIIHAITGDLKQAQELLGHAHISTTSDIYVHLDDKVAEEATELLAREIIPDRSLIVPPENDQIN